MRQNFEWDETKEMKNFRRHGIDFQEAITVFQDEFSLTFDDFTHSNDEERFIDIGRSAKGRILVVVYTERGNDIRIISCRKATTTEKIVYETQNT
jgi:uncharacterized DUF497 family protein